MVRREVYDKVGKFSLEYPYSSDYYQWLKVSRVCDIAYVHDALLYYRQGEHSESYRLLFESPLGYIDTLKIYTQLRKDLGEDCKNFAGEFNAAMRRFINDCLFAGVTRVDNMRGYPPSLFSGLALSAWGLITPQSARESIKTMGSLMLILGSGLVMWSSTLRKIVKRLMYKRMERY